MMKRKKVYASSKSRIRDVMRTANRIDFSCVEDNSTAIQSIRAIASEAVKTAVNRNAKLRLPGIRIEDNRILQVNATGEREVIATIRHRTPTIYKRGQVLHARKS